MIVAAALVINVLIIPAVAWGMANLFPISSEQVVGLVLVCVASASAAISRLTETSSAIE